MTNKNDNYKVKDIETADLGAIEMEIVGTDEDGEETVRIKGFSPAPTSLLQAIERIDRVVVEERLDKDALKAATPEIEYLAKRIGVSALQAVLFSVLVNHGSNMSISNLADHLSISNAQALSLLKEMKELERLHLLEIDDSFSGITFSIPSRVLIQLSRNKDFKHERTTGLDSGEFLTYVHNIFTKVYDNDIDREQLIEEIQNLLGDNKKCNFVKALKKLRVNESYGLVMLMLSSALYVDDRELMGINLLRPCAQNTAQYKAWKRDLRAGTHDLMKKDLIEFGCEDGIANTRTIMLTKKARELLLSDVEITANDEQQPVSGIIQSSTIKPKELYYSSEVTKLVNDLTKFFDQENYKNILERMEKSNFRRAFTCLFYGGPGTGKTETVNQLALHSGRDIMLVDVPSLKDKWVGESEKNVKAVFDRYRDLVRKSKVAPILLFNEADSIFGKRLTEVNHSVDQMLNTMQNIILQEMENLDGILIATTNLTENLDSAFERRFLYKIKFESPDVEAREHIWHAMIPELTHEEVGRLASSYEFSGGQIENVARKFSINNILYGNHEDSRMESIFSFCDNELIQDSNSQMRRVGF